MTLKEQGFYHTTAWRRLRRAALSRDHYVCQACLRNGTRPPHTATEVHHKKPLEDFPELALDLDNLESLCWQCHEETKRQDHHEQSGPAGVRVIKI